MLLKNYILVKKISNIEGLILPQNYFQNLEKKNFYNQVEEKQYISLCLKSKTIIVFTNKFNMRKLAEKMALNKQLIRNKLQ